MGAPVLTLAAAGSLRGHLPSGLGVPAHETGRGVVPGSRNLGTRRRWVLVLCAAVGATPAGLLGQAAEGGRSMRGAALDAARPAVDVASFAAAQATNQPRRRLVLVLCFFDIHAELTSQYRALTGELDAVFREMGVELMWRPNPQNGVCGDAPDREVPVVVLKSAPSFTPDALGLVPRSRCPAYVQVFVENIRRSIGVAPDRPGYMRGLVGIASGRVIAHELVHVLAPEFAHTRDGLMRQTLTRRDLTASNRPSLGECPDVVRAALQQSCRRFRRDAEDWAVDGPYGTYCRGRCFRDRLWGVGRRETVLFALGDGSVESVCPPS